MILFVIVGFACISLADDSSFKDNILKRHNYYRQKHGVDALTWNEEVAAYARQWAETLASQNAMRHRGQNRYGENIYYKSGGSFDADMPVDAWYAEVKDYNFNRQGFSYKTGHFTQVVWKGSTELGCGMARSSSGAVYVVCNYSPPGNYMGRFDKNVLPPVK